MGLLNREEMVAALEQLVRKHGMYDVLIALADIGEVNRPALPPGRPEAAILDRNWDSCLAKLRGVSWMIIRTTQQPD